MREWQYLHPCVCLNHLHYTCGKNNIKNATWSKRNATSTCIMPATSNHVAEASNTLVFRIQCTSMLEVDMLENRCTPSTMVASTFTPLHNLPIACNKTQLPLCRTCNHITIMHHAVHIMVVVGTNLLQMTHLVDIMSLPSTLHWFVVDNIKSPPSKIWGITPTIKKGKYSTSTLVEFQIVVYLRKKWV